MKRKGMLFLVMAMMFTLFATSALAAQTIKVTIDGEDLAMEQPPVEQQGRTLVPMRAIFEALGAKVDWDGQTQAITATKGDVTIKMAIDQKNMTVNEESIALDVAPTLVNESTMVPARAVAESFDAKVDWDAANQQVIITTAAEEAPSTVVKTIEDSVKAEDGTVLMTIKATYPVLDNADNAAGINTINAAFQKMAEDYVSEVKAQYAEEAEAEAFYIKDNTLFKAYAFEMNFEISCNNEKIVSGATAKIANTNGAHPNLSLIHI